RDHAAFGPRLVRDERHAEHAVGELLGVLGRPRELDAAAFAAAAGVNLRLDDNDFRAEAAGDRRRLRRAGERLTTRHRHAVARQDALRLILVDFHGTGKAADRITRPA